MYALLRFSGARASGRRCLIGRLARRLRQELGLKNATLLAITGYGQDEDRRRSREAGFDAHLVKPIDPKDLNRLLAGLSSLSNVR